MLLTGCELPIIPPPGSPQQVVDAFTATDRQPQAVVNFKLTIRIHHIHPFCRISEELSGLGSLYWSAVSLGSDGPI